MTQLSIHSTLALTVLQHVTIERLQKAIHALGENSLTLTVTRQTEVEIRASVKNGEGKEYGVTLTEVNTFCSCPDALYRGVICKHATVLALTILRTPCIQEEQPAQSVPNLKLTRVRSQTESYRD
jgi:uncharacterized Zn finger protein